MVLLSESLVGDPTAIKLLVMGNDPCGLYLGGEGARPRDVKSSTLSVDMYWWAHAPPAQRTFRKTVLVVFA